jgi:hypothetical protein
MNTPMATITPNSETTFCEGGTLILSANIGTTYLWSNDSITQNIAVTTSGVYQLTITDENGCTGISEYD